MHPSEIVDRLEAVEPLRLQAISLLLEMDDAFSADVFCTDEMIGLGDEIEAAVDALSSHAKRVGELEERCSNLQPIPSKIPPHGF
jgi:hypothetical protein